MTWMLMDGELSAHPGIKSRCLAVGLVAGFAHQTLEESLKLFPLPAKWGRKLNLPEEGSGRWSVTLRNRCWFLFYFILYSSSSILFHILVAKCLNGHIRTSSVLLHSLFWHRQNAPRAPHPPPTPSPLYMNIKV